MISQGARANANGRAAEQVIAGMLDRKRLLYQTQAPIGRGIYDTPLRADFFIIAAHGFPCGLIIECKWQDTPGSVDEKFPYLVANIKTCYPAPTIVMLDGGGYRAGAAAWLAAQIDGTSLIAVYSLGDFLAWSNRHLMP